MAGVIDARFAGPLVMELRSMQWAPGQVLVNVVGPGFEFDLFPDEAAEFGYLMQLHAKHAATANKKNAPAPAATGNEGQASNEGHQL